MVRPSYVLGGRAMEIVYEKSQLKDFVEEAFKAGENNPILIALESKNTKIKKMINNVDEHELQIIVSVINKNKKVVDYKFNLNADNYYYPASTVKLPISVFALEKINEYPLINIDTPYKIENDTAFYTIRKDINEIMVMSSNESYNRLFEFLGQNSEINIKNNNSPEFYDWKWVNPKHVSNEIVNFKKDIYEMPCFLHYLT